MKRKYTATTASALALSFLLSAPLAMAQQHPMNGPGQHGPQGPAQHSESHSSPGPMAPMQHPPQQYVQVQHPPGPPPGYNHPPGPPPGNWHDNNPPQQAHWQGDGRHWHQGDHYDGQRYAVQNWDYYHLRQPPAGYEWVQDGSQFVLIAVASGIIADIILNSEQ